MSETRGAEAALLERLEALAEKADAFFARVRARYPDALACGPGCASCCAPHLEVTPLEARALGQHVASLPPHEREALAARARAGRDDACVALDPEGRCDVYRARPLVCRTHGVPIRLASAEPVKSRRALPMLSVCERNFRELDLADVSPDCVLDQTTLSTVLGALDAALADAESRPRGERVALAQVLAGAPLI
jgi:Fe-S-cluster containining protein